MSQASQVQSASMDAVASSFNVDFTIQDLFANLLHYGHKIEFKNPKMSEFIFQEKDKIAIIDLVQTKHYLQSALFEIYKIAKKNGRILFVGTKPSISKSVKQNALSCGQYYVNNRWLGGTLTNWDTISSLLLRLDRLEKTVKNDSAKYTKKETLKMTKDIQKLERNIGGLKGMRNRPDAIVVIDANYSKAALKEAKDIGIKTFAVVDTNSDPEGIHYIIPANDDSLKSVDFILGLFSKVIMQGLKDNVINYSKPKDSNSDNQNKNEKDKKIKK